MPTAAHYLVLWEFHVKPERVSEFERTYGPDGSWAQLFRQSPDFLGTELIRDIEGHDRYLTLDRWTSREALERFKQEHAAEYAALDKECENYTEREVFLGDFLTV